jgi:hypothetical protein
MSEDAFNKINTKIQQLLTKLTKMFPGEKRLMDVQTKFNTARGLNYKMPGQVLYDKLKAKRALLELAARVEHSGVEKFNLKSLPFPELEHLDITTVSDADKRYCWMLIRDIIRLTGHELPAPVSESVLKFNRIYTSFLKNLCVAFPGGEDLVMKKYSEQMELDPAGLCFEQFKTAVQPYLRNLLKDPGVFVATPQFLQSLPYIGQLPLAEFWEVSVLNSGDTQDYIIRRINDLMMISTGVDNINPAIMERLQSTIAVSADQTIDAHTAVEALFKEIQTNGDMKALLTQMQGNLGRIDVATISEAVKDHIPPEFERSMQQLFSGKTGSKSPFDGK